MIAILYAAFFAATAVSAATTPDSSIPPTPLLPHPKIVASLPGTAVANITECPPLTPRATIPTSVTDIRPDDIKVYMALGDSITAGLFEEGWEGLKTINENRASAWSAGGKPDTSTLANFFRQYSPNIKGPSTGDNIGLTLCYGPLCPPQIYQPTQGYNLALSGALISNVHLEVDALIERVKIDGIVDIKNDWKYLTILIGANDLCLACANLLSPDSYERMLRMNIEKLRAAFPRMIIHISTMFKVSEIYGITKQKPYCATLRDIGGFVECPCAFAGKDTALGGYWRGKMDAAADAWNVRIMQIARDYVGKYEDFAVIADPGTGGTPIHSFGIEFISNVDCFHPSAHGHALLARGTWNNLFHAQKDKVTAYQITDALPLYCPTDADRIQVA
ncbi:hypothetical protein BDZ88DRAFT_22688 [Geranomyces variabilis]|nr:hypothetical protein BDZ88DRAFT_22688 [Geranomyces variabilis]KAJ3138955.1 hypothetical protein HDU90_000860 [Geranomyces variabilis]